MMMSVLLVIGALAGAQAPFHVSNTEEYSNVCSVEDGDVVGTTIRIVPAINGPHLSIQRYEGGPLAPNVFYPAVERDRLVVKSARNEVLYTIRRDGSDVLIKYLNGEAGRDGNSTEERLSPTIQNGNAFPSCR
ncbi:hypothetical protein JR064_21280 [Xanthomonas sp. CFBP 8703]|uniref:Uncharacterized protein n=2 Tax=Xanthomonas bonasiae TaxID=2810351 RepID=A0ABS3B8N0_9XANT|nr:hypothetical protein [Xanthomonas bonasiae]